MTQVTARPETATQGSGAGSGRLLPRRPQRQRDRISWRDTLTGWAFVAPASALIIGLAFFPAGWAFLISRQNTDLITPATPVGWANYQLMMEDPGVRGAVLHTLFFASLYVPISIVGGLVLAVALNREIRFQWFYRTCIFVPFVASAAATGILANFVFDPDFGIANNVLRHLGLPKQGFLTDPTQAMIVLVVISLWGSIGFNVVIYLAALQDVSRDTIDAARVDGAGPLRTFWHIVLPELRPVTVFTTIWQMIAALQLFDLVYTTTKGQPLDSTVTIVFYLYTQAFPLNGGAGAFGYGSAIAYGVFAVTMLLTLAMIAYSRRAKVEAF
ncbi:MAG: sugar ABC transporter permease [Nocardioidaceae bacterium]